MEKRGRERGWAVWARVVSAGALAVFVLVTTTACRSVPYTGRTQWIMTSESGEKSMGDEAWGELRQASKVSTDPALNAALVRVGQHIAAAAEKPDYQWEFVVFDDAEPNAFCLPGGKVGVYSGLFEYVGNDAELATVVGHEVSHAIARHAGEDMFWSGFWDLTVEAAATAATVAVGDGGAAVAQAVRVTGLGSPLLMKHYSREQEYEADYLGMIFMAKAGYDPRAALAFWDKFGKLSQTSRLGEFLSTHPIGEKRVQEIQKNMPEALKFYRDAPVKQKNYAISPSSAPTRR